MSLRDDVEAARKHVGPQCGVPKLLAKIIDEAFRVEIADAVADPLVEPAALSRALRDIHKVELSDYLIRRHRDRRCQCR